MKEEPDVDQITIESDAKEIAPLEVLYCDDPLLKKTSRKVYLIDNALLGIVEDMIKTMMAYRGLGLAAPQIGLNKRFFVFIPNPGEFDDDDGEVEVRVAINPQIIEKQGEHISYEGCLSYPEYYAHVRRAIKIRVKYQDLDMNKIEEEFEGLAARIFQHELDHLDGILFTDRMEEGSLKHADDLNDDNEDEPEIDAENNGIVK